MRWVTLSSASCVCLDWIDHWSFTLDEGLSHFLYPHTTHMSMFNECHIHSCDCTCLNVFSHSQSLLINHKKIFENISCFWKVFCFYKNLSKFQKQCCSVLATQSRVGLVVCPSYELTQRFSRLKSRLFHEWNFQSRKTLRKFFKIFSVKCSGG